MNKTRELPLTRMAILGRGNIEDASTPSIIRNIEKMAEKYQKFIDSEIIDEQMSQSIQAERVKKLKESGSKSDKASSQ